MSKRSEIRTIARNIKRETGLDHPTAFGMAKVIQKDGRSMLKYNDKYKDHLEMHDTFGCGPECCGYNYEVDAIKGPKGTIDIDDITKPVEPKASKGMPEKVRTIRVRLLNVDRALTALRCAGIDAMLAQGLPVPSPVNGERMAMLAINTSGNKAHKILVAAGVTPPVSRNDLIRAVR